MKIECPACGGHYDVGAEYIGQTIKCPDCDSDFVVDNPNLTQCPDCFNKISKRARTCPHCGAELNDPFAGRASSCSAAQQDNINDEVEIMECHPSVINYLPVIIIGILTIPVLIGIIILLNIWIEINFTSYKITTMRIIVRRGLITKHQNEIWIKDMRGANLFQNLWQRIVGIGNISVGTAATSGTEISMIGIANPQEVVDQINALRHQ